METKKLSEEMTYKKITIEHTIEINSKEVRIYDHQFYDSIGNDYDNDTVINEKDLKTLTPEEEKMLGEFMQEVLALKVAEVLSHQND